MRIRYLLSTILLCLVVVFYQNFSWRSIVAVIYPPAAATTAAIQVVKEIKPIVTTAVQALENQVKGLAKLAFKPTVKNLLEYATTTANDIRNEVVVALSLVSNCKLNQTGGIVTYCFDSDEQSRLDAAIGMLQSYPGQMKIESGYVAPWSHTKKYTSAIYNLNSKTVSILYPEFKVVCGKVSSLWGCHTAAGNWSGPSGITGSGLGQITTISAGILFHEAHHSPYGGHTSGVAADKDLNGPYALEAMFLVDASNGFFPNLALGDKSLAFATAADTVNYHLTVDQNLKNKVLNRNQNQGSVAQNTLTEGVNLDLAIESRKSKSLATLTGVQIISMASNKCLSNDGVRVYQADCTEGNPDQKWTFSRINHNGDFIIGTITNRFCLRVSDASKNNGAGLSLSPCTLPIADDYIWQMVSAGKDTYQIISLNSGACLDLEDSNNFYLDKIKQFDCKSTNNSNQIWKISGTDYTPNHSCAIDGKTYAHGTGVRGYMYDVSASCEDDEGFQMCNDGFWSGGYQFKSCRQGKYCTFNDLTLKHGQEVAAYIEYTSPDNCANNREYRKCNDGILSGSYKYRYCGLPCTVKGQTVQHGETVTSYEVSKATDCKTVKTASAICYNGSLSGGYQFDSCTNIAKGNCTLGSKEIKNGETIVAYQKPNALNCSSIQINRKCINGILDGSSDYVYESCRK